MSVLQKRRKELRTELASIEKQIYDLETTYLEETKDFGNVFTGWAGYLSHEKIKPKKHILNEDRHFSLSSTSSPASRREEIKKVEFHFVCSLFYLTFNLQANKSTQPSGDNATTTAAGHVDGSKRSKKRKSSVDIVVKAEDSD